MNFFDAWFVVPLLGLIKARRYFWTTVEVVAAIVTVTGAAMRVLFGPEHLLNFPDPYLEQGAVKSGQVALAAIILDKSRDKEYKQITRSSCKDVGR